MANTPSNLPSPPPMPPPPLPHRISGGFHSNRDDLFLHAELLREGLARQLLATAANARDDVVALPAQSDAGSMSAAEADFYNDEFSLTSSETDDDGLPEEVVARFLETEAAPRGAADGGDSDEACAVCLDDVHREGRTVGVLGCRHRFHSDCIGKWLVKKNDCPLCRATAVEM